MELKNNTIWFAANISPDSYGGIGRVIHEYSRQLSSRGYNCRIMVNAPGKDTGYLRFAFTLLMTLITNIFSPPDWIIARSTDGVFCALFVRFFGGILRIPTRVAIHSHGWEERAYEIENRLPKDILIPRTLIVAHMIRFPLLRTALYAGDRCITGTISEMRWLSRNYPTMKHKCAYLPNGVESASRIVTFSDDNIRFLSIGAATWKKNIEHTANVFDHIQDTSLECTLTMVGTTGETVKHLREKSLWKVKILHETPFRAMEQLYETHDVLISSSRFEGGHSLAVLEAMAHGMVVFVSEIDSMKEIIQDQVNGVFITGIDPCADARKIVSILRDRAKTTRIAQRALKSAARNSWARQSIRLERILTDA